MSSKDPIISAAGAVAGLVLGQHMEAQQAEDWNKAFAPTAQAMQDIADDAASTVVGVQAETLAPAVAGSSTGLALQQPAALSQSVTPCSYEDGGDGSVYVPMVTEQIGGWGKSATGAWIKQEFAPGPPVNAAVHGSDNISDVSSVREQLMQSGHVHNSVLNINNKQPKVMHHPAPVPPPATVLQRRVQQLQPVPEAMPAAQATREEAKRGRKKLLRLQQQQFIDDKKAECERKNKEFNEWRLGA